MVKRLSEVCLPLSEACWSEGLGYGGGQGAQSRLSPSNTQDTEVEFKVIIKYRSVGSRKDL